MANERLGIFEELRDRRERLMQQSEAVRRRILGVGPTVRNGPYAQLQNPFKIKSDKPVMMLGYLRVKNITPFYERKHQSPDDPLAHIRRRAVWPEAKLGLNVVQVVQAVVLESGLTTGELLDSPSRHRRLAWPRHVAMWAVDRYCPDFSLNEIGFIFHRDHSSVKHGIEATVVRLSMKESSTVELIARVRERLNHAAQVAA